MSIATGGAVPRSSVSVSPATTTRSAGPDFSSRSGASKRSVPRVSSGAVSTDMVRRST